MNFPRVRTNGSNGALIEDFLGGTGSLTAGDDLHAAESLRAEGTFDACVLAIGAEDDTYDCLEFCDRIRNNPRLFNLPVLLLASTGTFPDPVEPFRHRATRVMERPLQKEELRYGLTTLIKRHRLRWSIRHALDRTKQGATLDEATGAYT